jgi:hypothetical protein
MVQATATRPGPCGGSAEREREIESMLAVRLFGWHRADGGGWKAPAGRAASHLCPHDGGPPHWAQTWEGAGEVIDAMHELGYAVHVNAPSTSMGRKPSDGWVVSFAKEPELAVRSLSAPCAIALAALRALGQSPPPGATPGFD